jgi:hypothetical protein
MNTIKHALSEESECQQQWYAEHFGETAKLCSLFEVDFFGGFNTQQKTFTLYREPINNKFDNDSEHVLTTTKSKLFLEDIDVVTYEYAFKICEDSSGSLICKETFYPLDSTAADPTQKPTGCN